MRFVIVKSGFIAGTVLAATIAGAAPGDEKKPPDLDKIFARKDADKDGALTLDEFKAGMKPKA